MNSLDAAAAPAAPPPPQILPSCPRCRSIDIEPIPPVATITTREAIETAWDEAWAGRGRRATRYLARWTCLRVANALQHDTHQCRYCGLTFREGQT